MRTRTVLGLTASLLCMLPGTAAPASAETVSRLAPRASVIDTHGGARRAAAISSRFSVPKPPSIPVAQPAGPGGPGGSSGIVPLGLLVLAIIAVAAVVVERGRRAAARVRAVAAVSAKGGSAPVRADSQAKPDVPSPPLPLIDSLRAIAALSVLLVHAEFYSGMESSPTLGPYAQRLDVGVSVFFVISGLLLYRPFAVARLRDRARPDTQAYAWRRFLRIMPAYWLALTVVGLFFTESATAPAVFSSDGFPRYYLLIQNYWTSSIGGGMGQAWTLSIEVAFYVMLPLYAWFSEASASARAATPSGRRSSASWACCRSQRRGSGTGSRISGASRHGSTPCRRTSISSRSAWRWPC